MQFIKLDTKICRKISQLSADTDKKFKFITEDRKIGSRFANTLLTSIGKADKQ